MRIEPRFLAPHLEAAAIEQVAAQLRADGFDVEQQVPITASRGGLTMFDIVAHRGTEKLFVEVKVSGAGGSAKSEQLRHLAALAKQEGGRFRLVVVRPERDVAVHVLGLEDALRTALARESAVFFAPLGYPVSVAAVSDVEIERLAVKAGNRIDVAGSAMVRINPRGQDLEVPFTFQATLAPDGSVEDQPRFAFDFASTLL